MSAVEITRDRKSKVWARDPHDWYVEPERVTDALLSVERFIGAVWDPACGQGNVLRACGRAGLMFVGTDVVSRTPLAWATTDFLAEGVKGLAPNIITNPPFFRAAGTEAFIRRALSLATGKVAIFADLGFLAGKKRAEGLFAEHPPARAWIITPRPSCPPGRYLLDGRRCGRRHGRLVLARLVKDRAAYRDAARMAEEDSMTTVVALRPGDAPPVPVISNLAAEQALLGALLMNNACYAAIAATLRAEHFAEPIHRNIYEVASTLIGRGDAATVVTLQTWLPPNEIVPGVSVPQYLANLAANAVGVLIAPDFARTVTELHVRRLLHAKAGEIADLARDPHVSLSSEDMLTKAEEALTELRALAPTREVTSSTAAELADDLLDSINRIRSGEERTHGVPTGLADIDWDTGGMQPGQLWLVAGRPSMGKTIIATRLVRSAADSGSGAILFSLEVGRRQIMARFLADIAWTKRHRIGFGAILRAKDLSDDDMVRLDMAGRHFRTLPITTVYPSGIKVAEIGARVRIEKERMARRGVRLGVVVIDYLDFIQAGDRYKGNRVYEVGEVSRTLRQLAKDQGVCIVLLAQLNRQVEGRPDKRPQMSDLRDSGSLEQDADVVALLYRDAYYIERSAEYAKGDPDALQALADTQHTLEFIVAKNRTGRTRKHDLWCDVASSMVTSRDMGD